MGELTKLKNIGPETEGWLNEIGIETPEQLVMTGVVRAWQQVKAHHHDATLTGLYALQGALINMHWNDIPQEMKDELKAQYESWDD